MKKAALITGASGGIGMELARIFAKENDYNLILVARSEDKLEALKDETEAKSKIQVHVLVKDLVKPESASEVFDFAKDMNVEVLINNAGFGDYSLFHESDLQRQTGMIDLNIRTLTVITHLFLPEMIKNKKGRIMNVASTAAFQPGPYMSVYYATKAYVLYFSEAIASELKDKGVTVTALCPGPTTTNFQSAANLQESKLFNYMKFTTATEVAQYGYKAMMKGKVIAIPGGMNKFMAKSVRFFPRRMVTNTVMKMSKKN